MADGSHIGSTDTEHLHYQRKFDEWGSFAVLVHAPFHVAVFVFFWVWEGELSHNLFGTVCL